MMHNILWLTFPVFLTLEWRFLVSLSQGKIKEWRRFLWKSLTWNTRESMALTVTKAKIHQPHICILLPDIDKLCPPLLFPFSLSNYWTRSRWTKAIHNDYSEKKKELFTKTNKNQYIKTIFLARQKAYKNIH